MAITLLDAVREVCARLTLPTPTAVFGVQDDQLSQLAALANEVCTIITTNENWTGLQYQALFTTVNGSNQGSMDTIAPGCIGVVPDSFWDRTRRLPFLGPIQPEEWQKLLAIPASSPYYAFRIFQGSLYLWPDGVGGHTCAFEYTSRLVIKDNTGASPVYKRRFTKDTDIFVLDDDLLILGLKALWLNAKGMPSSMETGLWQQLVTNLANADGPAPTLNMGDTLDYFPRPGVLVPIGSWPVTNGTGNFP